MFFVEMFVVVLIVQVLVVVFTVFVVVRVVQGVSGMVIIGVRRGRGGMRSVWMCCGRRGGAR